MAAGSWRQTGGVGFFSHRCIQAVTEFELVSGKLEVHQFSQLSSPLSSQEWGQ